MADDEERSVDYIPALDNAQLKLDCLRLAVGMTTDEHALARHLADAEVIYAWLFEEEVSDGGEDISDAEIVDSASVSRVRHN